MFTLRHMKIGQRLALAFGSLLLIVLLLGAFGIAQQQKINHLAQQLGHRWLPGVRITGQINDAFNQARRTSLRYLLDESGNRPALLAARDDVVNKTVPALFLKYDALMSSPEARGKMDEVKRRWSAYLAADERLLDLSGRGASHFQEARLLAAGATATDYIAAVEALGAVADWGNERGGAISAAADRQYTQGMLLSVSAIAVALALGVLLARTIAGSIVRPLRQGVAIAETVAGGDLTLRIEAQEGDEVADLLRAMQKMSADLSALVGSVRACSARIATGADEIAAGNADLSQRTEEQAGNLEATAASMAQFTSAARANADTALRANDLAGAASRAAAAGGTVVGEVVRTMARIQDAARRIGDITGLIDGIAFQTNILALNAAVEAARAGDRGRGFAVVAAEVRNLAQRSAAAAREIKALIDDSVATVDTGTGQAGLAGRNMRDIVAQVQRVGQLIDTISNATSEQTAGIAHVGGAIGELDRVTQQNAALVEQSAAAAESLRAQAGELERLVATFRTVEAAGIPDRAIQLARFLPG